MTNNTITASGTTTTAIMATLDHAAPAWTIEKFTGSLREPDFYDEGKAYWLTPEAVVSIDVLKVTEIEHILALEPRIRHHENGWTRIHPSHYGVQVDALDGRSHDAHGAWAHITKAVKA